jgi:hypothetical protein
MSVGGTPVGNDIDPDKILIECGITTPVLTSNTSSLSLITSATSLSNEEPHMSQQQHHQFNGSQTKSIMKK